ncbi:MAG TPA: NADP-dependent oxidoreductase [Acidimicrobiales bacterium]|nr:NADP-dependent oxidoreductase [Acidimicrobiales bacterium]
MKAIGVTEWGGPEALQVLDLPDPVTGPGEVRIRVHAATVNPTDTGLRAGARADQLKEWPPPYIPGMEVAGVLEEIGEGAATDLAVGDRVMAIVLPVRPKGGGYAERVVVPAESVVAVPAGASDAEAATLPMNGLTARMALDLLELAPGQVLGVTGAAGALGGYVVQLGKAEGLRVVADASAADEALVRDLGADVVVRRGDDFADRVRAEVPEGVDGLVDAALLNQLAVGAVRDGGRIVTARGYTAAGERGVTFHPVLVAGYAKETGKLDRLRQQAEDGVLTLRVAATMPAETAVAAHRQLEAGGVRGRLVLEF